MCTLFPFIASLWPFWSASIIIRKHTLNHRALCLCLLGLLLTSLESFQPLCVNVCTTVVVLLVVFDEVEKPVFFFNKYIICWDSHFHSLCLCLNVFPFLLFYLFMSSLFHTASSVLCIFSLCLLSKHRLNPFFSALIVPTQLFTSRNTDTFALTLCPSMFHHVWGIAALQNIFIFQLIVGVSVNSVFFQVLETIKA